MNFDKEILDQIIKETKRRLIEEGVSRVIKCLGMLNEEEIWHRPNEQSNSVGNLVLHLCGNVRQYVVSGIGGKTDTRKRQSEFDEKGPVPTEKLIRDLNSLVEEVELVLDQLDPHELVEARKVQGFDETVVGILIHVTEHFSYHVGQISYFVKAKQNRDLGYYDGLDLDITS